MKREGGRGGDGGGRKRRVESEKKGRRGKLEGGGEAHGTHQLPQINALLPL